MIVQLERYNHEKPIQVRLAKLAENCVVYFRDRGYSVVEIRLGELRPYG